MRMNLTALAFAVINRIDHNDRSAFYVDSWSICQSLLCFRGDHTWVDLYITVLPPKTDAVLFSIDGSFTASVSIMGKDPKVRPGSVDIVR